jgi:hypothetical protein
MTKTELLLTMITSYKDEHSGWKYESEFKNSYENSMQRLTEFSGRVEELFQQIGGENLSKRDMFRVFMHSVVALDQETRELEGQIVERGYYREADTNLLKGFQFIGNLTSETIWRVRREVYEQDKYLSLGLFILRYSDQLNTYIQKRHNQPLSVTTELPSAENSLRDWEYMIVNAWDFGGAIVQGFLTDKATIRYREGFLCPFTRQILIEHGKLAE